MPVILIVYDVPKDTAYWLYVQSHFGRLKDFNLFAAGQYITVHVPVRNVVTTAAIRRLARFRDRVLEQMRKVIHDEDSIPYVRRVPALPGGVGLRGEAG